MKLLVKIFVIVLIVLVVLVLGRNILVKALVENGAAIALGTPVSMKKLDISLNKSFIDIEGLVVKNPGGFHGTTFIDVPKIYVDYNLSSILKGNIHLEKLELDLKELNVVKNEKGELNLDKLKSIQKAKEEKPAEPKEKAEAPTFQIDELHLKVGKAAFIDYSGGEKSVKDFNVGIDENFKDITDPNKLIALIVMKVMIKTSLGKLSGFNVGSLQDGLSGIKDSAGNMAVKALTTFEETGSVKDASDAVTGGLKGAVSSIKDKFKF